MGNILGLDTGGTFTDAAIIDSNNFSVIRTSKSLTTRHDLSVGVGHAMKLALGIESANDTLCYSSGSQNKLTAESINLVSLSTTLATNSMVENAGSNVALILIGFDQKTLKLGKLAKAIAQNPVIFIKGGHKSDGTLQFPLDTKNLLKEIRVKAPKVSAFAVASYFATRNPEHEIIAREYIRKYVGMPVSCSYELSASLGGPKRALTAFLNAKLISLIETLINATRQQMQKIGLNCKLMVVKGDGSLVSAEFAKERPVETILSGPAASVSGAAYLANENTAIVCDIGGTTTDIALLKDGSIDLSSNGAEISGWNTMVEAIKISTSGLGGDSEMYIDSEPTLNSVQLGPRRALPLSLLSNQFPSCLDIMKKQLSAPIPLSTDGRFIIPLMTGKAPSWLARSEARMAERLIKCGISALADIADTRVAYGAIDRLISKGLAQLSCFTPTDAVHVLGKFNKYNEKAAYLGALLCARQKNNKGEVIATTAEELSQLCINQLCSASAIKIADVSIEKDNGTKGSASNTHAIKEALSNLSQESNLLQHNIKLSVPIIALGASARTHYPDIAKRLNTKLNIPKYAEVAGAIGAAIGNIHQQSSITITQPQEGVFRVHLIEGIKDFKSLEEALESTRYEAQKLSKQRAIKAGAKKLKTTVFEKIEMAEISNKKKLFIEAVITAKTIGNANYTE